MIVWGVSANSHDAALAVFTENKLEFASHSERFSGIKNDAHLNTKLIDYARRWGEPDKVVWYERPFRKTIRQLRAGQGWRHHENNVSSYLQSYDINAAINYSSHHRSHAAAGYFTSNFDDATVLVIDSIGEFQTLTVWQGRNESLTEHYSQSYPHSVGLWYSAMTQRIGLKPNEDEYILMGMAAYGDPYKHRQSIINDFIQCIDGPEVLFKENLHRGCRWWRPDLSTEQDIFDIAAATQLIYEEILDSILSYTSKYLPSDNIVIMGGCALNCSANSIAYKYYDNVWIMPNPGDAGSAIGSVLSAYNMRIEWPGPYLGYDIERPYPIKPVVAELIREGICGVANGRAEYGPRALGNRSLLADPRTHENKHRVNQIKQRQQFRPFAPLVLEEHAQDYFDGVVGPYMQFTAMVKDPDAIPAVVHADGTARVQTVGIHDNQGLRKLLEAWYAETGCPVLLNTSLNIKGKPMVNTEQDAKDFENMYGVKVW